MKPQKFRHATEEEALAAVGSPGWVAEQKMDGTRALVRLTAEGADWNGLKHTAATQWFKQIEGGLAEVIARLEPGDELWLDGEIMIHNGEYRVYDLPWARLNGSRAVTLESRFLSRRRRLEQLARVFTEPVSLVYQARSELAKARLLLDVEAAGGEGVVFKRLNAAYKPGWRVDHQLKYQFIQRADLVVMKHSERSATLGAYRDGELLPVASCSLIGKPHVEVGFVCELKYLNWSGGSLIQPRMVRVREDKKPEDCTWDQFRNYSREVV